MIAALVASAFAARAQPSSPGLQEIKVGMSGALSGPAKDLGQGMKTGIEAWFARVNSTGGVDGRTLRLTYAIAAAEKVTRIVELERRCCAFLDFKLKASANAVELTITAPEQEGSDAQWLFVQFLPATDLPDAPALKPSECA